MSRPLFLRPDSTGNETWAIHLNKAVEQRDARSKDADNTGIVQHPFSWEAAKKFKCGDPHHSACIEAKRESTVGLGFEEDGIDDALDPLCSVTWQDVATAAVEDFWITGNGFVEAVRKGEKVAGLYHTPAERVWVEVENKEGDFHYRVRAADGREFIAAPFGRKKEFLARDIPGAQSASLDKADPDSVSEIIHIKRPTSQHKWYGMPDWLAAVAQIELAHAITQYNYDFFLNSGVPEFVLLISGVDLGDAWEKEIKPALQSHVGMGNAHKTLALNIPKDGVTVQVEKLGEEMKEGWFASMLDTVASRIVTAHRVPPLLAGIQIPGKLGANNEFINAMWMFQTLVVRPAQTAISKCLKRTLGGEFGVTNLKGNKFEMKTIVEEVPVAQVEAPGSMNETAKAPGSRKDVKGSAAVAKANTDSIDEWRAEMRAKYADADPEIIGKALGALLHVVFEKAA
jgi:PBSX family phage portal protein